jgi:YHS domain-containing protein
MITKNNLCTRLAIRIPRNIAAALIAFAWLPSVGFSQSGTKPPATSRTTAVPGSTTRAPIQEVALGGNCPVCVIEMKKWMKGDTRFSAQYDGKTYLFPGEEQRMMFLNNPAKYVPALGGDCTVCLAEMKKQVPGSIRFASLHRGRLYLFPGEEQRNMFLKNPDKYADVDLAAQGNCTVCRVEMNELVPGKPEFTVIHRGRRYQFPSREQQDIFVANPAKYEIK